MLFLIRDRAATYTPSCDNVFEAEGIEISKTPDRAPRANAFAASRIRSAQLDAWTGCGSWANGTSAA